MSQQQLITPNTPKFLHGVYSQLTELLSQETLDTERFFGLVTEREHLLLEWLEKDDNKSNKAAIEDEVKINEYLVELSESLKQQTQDSLSALIKSRQAIKKYYK